MKTVTKIVMNRVIAKRMAAKAKAAGVRMTWFYDGDTGRCTVIFLG